MDYGPFLTASIEAPTPKTNLAYKGIAINLGRTFGGQRNEAIVFDTDLLRYAAGWTGDFLTLKGVVFDGEHWAYPAISGPQLFGNPMLPGWDRGGVFQDPREQPFGPLPREWAHWQGLHLHGQKVILNYTVGGMRVREMPALERRNSISAFARVLNLGPSAEDHVLQLAFEARRPGRLVRIENLQPAAGDFHTGAVLAVLGLPDAPPDDRPKRPPAAEALLGHWDFEGVENGVAADRSSHRRALRLKDARRTPEGKMGAALEFNGQQFAEVDQPDAVDFIQSDLTIAAWIKTRQDGTIWSKTLPDSRWVPDGKALFVRGGRLTFDVGWVGAVQSSQRVNDGEWHHVALAWSSEDGRATLYVDGRLGGSQALQPKGPVARHVVRIGFAATNFPAHPWFRGVLDDVRIYGRQLAPEEIATLAGQSAARPHVVAAGLVTETPDALEWLATRDGNLRLRLGAHLEPRRLKVLLWSGSQDDLPSFTGLVQAASPAEDLTPLTQGGPARWSEKLITHGKPGANSGPYAMDLITAPHDNPWDAWMRFGGVDLFADGRRAALCTWNGDVWIVSGVDGNLEQLTWQRVATGLFQPLGLKIVHEQIYVLGRDQITRLHDLNGDGEADYYENFNNDCMVSEHFHEFATDLKTDADGNFYYIKCARHALPALHPHHGTLLKLPPDGSRLEVVARGFRAVNGLGVGPQGELTCVDNQGHWMPGNRINWIKPGGWYGNQWAWPYPQPREEYDPPLCWMHNFVDRSGGTHLWVPTDRWGPLPGELITVSYGMGHVFLVLKEEVNGVMQGGVTRFPLEFDTGVMRGVFHPFNHQLYVAGLYGWAGNKTMPGDFYRVRYTGKPANLPRSLHIVRDGVVLGFTDPLDPDSATDPGNYDVKVWNLHWSATYGSPDFKLNGQEGRDTWRVQSATVSADHQTVFLELPEVQPVMQMHLELNLKAADGAPLRNFVHNTIHQVGRKAGLGLLGPGAIARAAEALIELQHEAPGLVQSLSLQSHPEATDRRVARLPALHVPAGAAGSPFLDAGPCQSTWAGYLKVDLNDEATFHLEGAGAVQLRVNQRTILDAPPGQLDSQTSAPIALRRGLNPFVMRYQSPPAGAAEIRLAWSSKRIRLEPVPASVFVHDPDDDSLKASLLAREGRALFATHQCLKCHADESLSRAITAADGARPASSAVRNGLATSGTGGTPILPIEAPAFMPELAADAPSFNGIGNRLHEAWLVQWLLDPQKFRPDAIMPKLFSSDPQQGKSDAQDVATYLASLRLPSGNPTNLIASDLALPAHVSAGKLHFAELGCVACHRLPGDQVLPNDPRQPLDHVSAKWQTAALLEFLRQPGRYYRWTPMPDFQLSESEALTLAAYIVSRTDSPPDALALPTQGNPDRGRQLTRRLGCLNCHNLDGETTTLAATPLARLLPSKWRTGCLGSNARQRGQAPDFAFTDAERGALRQFAQTDLRASLHRNVPLEFAERQYRQLRCNACHARDAETDFWSRLKPEHALALKSDTVNPFDSDDEGSGDAGSVHVGRPHLSFAGEKLYADWMARFFTGQLPYKPRSALQGRMPAFPAVGRELAIGLAHQHGYGTNTPPLPPVNSRLAALGRQLTAVSDGFSCVACHDVGEQKALAGKDTATINFAYIADRLRPSYYRRYIRDPQHILPGTMMPNFIGDDGTTPIKSVLDGDPDRQFTALWHYLMSLR